MTHRLGTPALDLITFLNFLVWISSKIKGRYGPDLDSLAGGHVVGVRVDHEARLHLLVNGVDQGVAAKEIPPTVYVVLDLYGQCQEVCVVVIHFCSARI
ncbi:Neuralized-like protein 4 [Portunus trituberculatus]|uniref:Neuralized-like protein 4 n=1 Tax=Portunus trituberculatus TaxID=210409 RepID=A0A5B7JI73_PORTR|nr:Neuralized-like protein 4 [Portunus trituberculatus]